ncbi:small multi-drug export protein [Paenibacillus naphthalenovorans]|uniref:small multi-drug export protein n=1 Tax=Paenibacillus naphthalenovorans TaxID=162209 RepID=UPI003D26E08B
MDMMQNNWGAAWQYVVVFLMAAAPWLDVFVVVPLGVAWGLNPFGVSIVAFVGNWIPLLLLALFFREFTAWRARVKARKALKRQMAAEASGGGSTAIEEGSSEAASSDLAGSPKKYRRARQIWEKYGVPGLALLAPALVGTDIATLLALSFGSSRRWVMSWMTVSLLVWTVLMAVGSVYGLGFIGWFDQSRVS